VRLGLTGLIVGAVTMATWDKDLAWLMAAVSPFTLTSVR
jgi:hypothetical protein